MTAKFPFNDLQSFKDYVVFVRMCAPDRFPLREGVQPDSQWTVELAFQGLREGLAFATKETKRDDLTKTLKLVDDAYEHYQAGKLREGFAELQQLRKLL